MTSNNGAAALFKTDNKNARNTGANSGSDGLNHGSRAARRLVIRHAYVVRQPALHRQVQYSSWPVGGQQGSWSTVRRIHPYLPTIDDRDAKYFN